MPMKEWIYRMQPVQLYIVLAWSALYFAVQLFLSHVSHSMVLLVASYHMLCNIIALTGCILTIKKSAVPTERDGCRLKPDARSVSQQLTSDGDSGSGKFAEVTPVRDSPEGSDAVAVAVNIAAANSPEETALKLKDKVKVKARQARESTLKNTFGWTRIDILTMLVVCIFMASFCFSAIIEALQTLSHIHHQDAMHFPVQILILGAMGLILNGLCYLLIGGYTYHQGSFLYITSSGNVILDHSITVDGLRKGDRRLSGSRRQVTPTHLRSKTKRQSVRELMRDICSSVIVIICSLIVYCTTEETAKFVDPALSILSCIILLTLSYPYMKESGMILLQTIPDTIDIEIFKKTLLDGFKDIVSVHDLHIWQLSGNQYVSTVHIIFDSPKVYLKIHNDVIEFFHEQGINQVTIQPEFKTPDKAHTLGDASKAGCLIQCRTVAQCAARQCCDTASQSDSDKDPLLEVVDLPSKIEPSTGEKIPMSAMAAKNVELCIEQPSGASSIDHMDTSSSSQTTVKRQATEAPEEPTVPGDAAQEGSTPSTSAQECTVTTTVQISPAKTEWEPPVENQSAKE